MSFKRDGNDANLLSVLQKRRINDLFAEDIPEEEAKLLSNGRFTCLVCHHHPIFDTVSMLSVHRQGKKHKHYADIKERKELEIKQLIEKRKQEEGMKNASSSIPVASMQSTGLLFSSPYDPRVRKHKKGDRKIQVDLHGSHHPPIISNHISQPDGEVEMKNRSTATSSSKLWLEVAEQQINGPITHDRKLKNIFVTKREEKAVPISPYLSRAKADNQMTTTGYNYGVSRKHFNETLHEGQSPPSVHSGSHQHTLICSSAHSDKPATVTGMNTSHSVFHHSNPSTSTTTMLPIGPKRPSKSSNVRSVKKTKKDKEFNNVQKRAVPVPEEKAVAEKYYQLQGSGWKRDWDGKWVKDEQAEFDSDEEPPTLP